MKTCLSCARLAVLPLALAAAFPSVAQTPFKETVVTATRVAQPLTDLVADVSIIDRETLERSGATGLADVLARIPGIEFARNGGPGTATSVFLRGGESRFTAVYIDGVRIDSQSTGGATWEAIPLAQIDRIEILRGPAGAVYGSDAIAGVIQIFTRRGEGAFAPFIGVGAGTHQTKKLDAGFSGSSGAFDYSLGLARELSDGFNARPIAGQNPDLDGYRNKSANARLGLQVNRAHRLEASLLSSDVDSQYDASLNKDDRNLRTLQTMGLNWQAIWSEQYRTRLSASESRDRYETVPSPYLSLTHLRGYLWQNEWRLGANLFTLALERREDQLENGSIDRSRFQNALALGYGWSKAQHTLQANLRHDRDSEFGGHSTGSLAYGYAFAPSWRATASAGTAFRAPTLFQRFSIHGVPTLEPESARNLEVGVRFSEKSSSFNLVAYRNKVDNLIAFVKGSGPCVNGALTVSAANRGCYGSTAHAEYSGITLSGAHRVRNVGLHASLDLQNPRDLDTGKQLARRARRHATLAADTRLGDWTVGAEVQLSAKRYDNAANTQVLGGYGLLNLYASARVAREWSVLARVDNVGDKDYQLARTYATAGRTFYVGVKWAPQ